MRVNNAYYVLPGDRVICPCCDEPLFRINRSIQLGDALMPEDVTPLNHAPDARGGELRCSCGAVAYRDGVFSSVEKSDGRDACNEAREFFAPTPDDLF